MDYRLSWHLRRARGNYVSRDELAEALDTIAEGASGDAARPVGRHGDRYGSVTTLSAALAEIRRAGFILDEHPTLGVRLVAGPPGLDRDELAFACRGRAIGRRVMVYQQTSSTNDVAAHVAQAGPAAHGTVIIAESQTGGRGRQGAPWLDVAGQSLLVSIPLWLSHPPMLAAATALAEAMEEVCPGVEVGIKWPNDLEIDRRKVAGILIEGGREAGVGGNSPAVEPGASGSEDGRSPSGKPGRGAKALRRLFIFGVGVNVNQQESDFSPEIRQRATSLRLACGEQVDRSLLLERMLVHLDTALSDLEAGRAASLRQRYDIHSDMAGRTVTLISGGQSYHGTVVSISPQYALVVRLDDGTLQAFEASNVRLG